MKRAATFLAVLLSSVLLADAASAQEAASADPSAGPLHGTWTRDVPRTLEAMRQRAELSEDIASAVKDAYGDSSVELTVREDGSLEIVYQSMGKTKTYGGSWTVASSGDGDVTAAISDVSVIEEKTDESEYVTINLELPENPRMTLTGEDELLVHGDEAEGPVPMVMVFTRQ